MQPITRNLKLIVLTAIISIVQLAAWAQEKKTEVSINVNKGDNGGWYSHPWVWIVGGLVFILLLVALLRGNNRN